LLEGFYKVRFQVDDAVGRSVMYAHAGSMLGGNSAFAHYGSFEEVDGVVTSEITSHRHNEDPNYQSLLGSDIATIDVKGSAEGDIYSFVGASPQMPGAVFRSVMTPIEDEIMPAMDAVGEGGIVNGLYSVHIRLLDGGLTGVMLIHDGRILGGDAFFISGPTARRTAAGKARSSIRNIRPPRASIRFSAAMKSGSVSPAPATSPARCWKHRTGRQAQPSPDCRAEADAPGLTSIGFARNAMAPAGVQR
jgi:hypothetical protein